MSDVPLDRARLFAIAQTNRTDLKALAAGYASQEAAVRKAIIDQFPTLALTVTGQSRYRGQSDRRAGDRLHLAVVEPQPRRDRDRARDARRAEGRI